MPSTSAARPQGQRTPAEDRASRRGAAVRLFAAVDPSPAAVAALRGDLPTEVPPTMRWADPDRRHVTRLVRSRLGPRPEHTVVER